MAREHVLVIEDDEDIQELLSFNLGREGYTVEVASTGEAGLERAHLGTVDAMSRLGYLYLLNGKWQGKQLLTKEYIDLVRQSPMEIRSLPVHNIEDFTKTACNHYGLLWWNNNDGTLKKVPRDTYWSWGLYDSLIVVIPSLDIVAARAGKSWKRPPGSRAS